MQPKLHHVALLSLLLAACGTVPNVTAHTPAAPDTLLTVPLSGQMSDEQLTQRYGGYVALKTNTFALIGNPTKQPLEAQGGRHPRPQPNRKVMRISEGQGGQTVEASGLAGLWGSGLAGLWGSGLAGLWGSGLAGLWGSGLAGLWGSGGFNGMPANTQSWQQIGLDTAHMKVVNSTNGATLAIIDSGIDLAHPMFAQRLSPPNTWKDFVDGDMHPQEAGTPGKGAYGHGTEVAGISLQIAPTAHIMPLRVLDAEGGGDVLNVASAIIWAVDHGANVINLSLGTGDRVEALSSAIDYANNAGVLVVAAAGNSNQSKIDYPAAEMATSELNVAVGSVNTADIKSSFSSYDGNVGLMAPGENIAGPYPEARIASWSGTSMSAPVVAGSLALGLGAGYTPQAALAHLKRTARSIDGVSGNESYAGKLGAGRIDLTHYLDTTTP